MRLLLASASPRRAELLTAAGIPFEVRAASVDETVRAGESARACVRRLAEEKARAVSAQVPGRPVLAADTIVLAAGEILGKPVDAADAARMLRMLSGATHEVMTGVCLIVPDVGRAADAARDEVVRLKPDTTDPVRLKPDTTDKPNPVRLKPDTTENKTLVRPKPDTTGDTTATNAGVVSGFSRTLSDVRVAVSAVTFAPLSEAEIAWYVGSGEPLDKAGAYAVQGLASRFVTGIQGSYSNVVGLPVALVYDMCRRSGILLS